MIPLPAQAILTSLPQAVGTSSDAGQTFSQEYRTVHGIGDIHGADATPQCLTLTGDGAGVALGTSRGAVVWENNSWVRLPFDPERPVVTMASVREPAGLILVQSDSAIHTGSSERIRLPGPVPTCVTALDGRLFLGTRDGVFEYSGRDWSCMSPVPQGDDGVRQLLVTPHDGLLALTARGVFARREADGWTELRAEDSAGRGWWFHDAAAAVETEDGRLWIACAQGIACRERDGSWRMFTGADGVPCLNVTSAAAGCGKVVFGTRRGLVVYQAGEWRYRQGRRYLPDDEVKSVAVDREGTVWVATGAGIAALRTRPMTFAAKAEFYEGQIDRFHRRTPYGYVLDVRVAAPGDTGSVYRHDSDNDGLWTAMYGAGECFAYAATGSPEARDRARQAYAALRFLGTVTQGGPHSPPPGFVARSVLPVADGDPNAQDYTPERDREKQERDRLWKVIAPRWPLSADGEWYWKCDTSSDELDGHYFFYGLYYDHVVETDEEREELREHVRTLTDHLVDHDFCLIDHDGEPTRWGVFRPSLLNDDPDWFPERGLNCLSMLAYLAVAGHITGEGRYRAVMNKLVDEHQYLQNMMTPKTHAGAGSGNQSDDEMAFMGYYHLIRYEEDPRRKACYALSMKRYWQLEAPEMNPFFNFVYAACGKGLSYSSPHGTVDLEPVDDQWLRDALETLRRLPLDRFDWRHDNRERLDILPLPETAYLSDQDRRRAKGCRMDGKVIPVDERYFSHWNHDPWSLETGGEGLTLADGAVYTLPCYMGMYHGFVDRGRPVQEQR